MPEQWEWIWLGFGTLIGIWRLDRDPEHLPYELTFDFLRGVAIAGAGFGLAAFEHGWQNAFTELHESAWWFWVTLVALVAHTFSPLSYFRGRFKVKKNLAFLSGILALISPWAVVAGWLTAAGGSWARKPRSVYSLISLLVASVVHLSSGPHEGGLMAALVLAFVALLPYEADMDELLDLP